MKKLLFLRIVLILIFSSVLCHQCFVCSAIDYSIVSECLDNALKLREGGDIDGAIESLQSLLWLMYRTDSFERDSAFRADEDVYTKEYLEFLIECLRANENETTYVAVIRHITSVIKQTRELFLEIADELKTGKISAKSASLIKEMKHKVSREMVTHSFCVPLAKYKEVYVVTREALFRYSRAWRNLELITFRDTAGKASLEIEALLNFQRGNELFSHAGALMAAMPKT